jgi:hypothetical protein
MAGGLITFIREQMGFPIPSPMLLSPVSQAYRTDVEKFAEEQGLTIVNFAHGEEKDETARAHLAKFEKRSGVVLIGKARGIFVEGSGLHSGDGIQIPPSPPAWKNQVSLRNLVLFSPFKKTISSFYSYTFSPSASAFGASASTSRADGALVSNSR